MIGKFMDKLIKTIRQSAGMNQEQFAKALGTTALSVNRWENGKTQPNKMAQTQLFEFCKKNNIDLFDYKAGKSKSGRRQIYCLPRFKERHFGKDFADKQGILRFRQRILSRH